MTRAPHTRLSGADAAGTLRMTAVTNNVNNSVVALPPQRTLRRSVTAAHPYLNAEAAHASSLAKPS